METDRTSPAPKTSKAEEQEGEAPHKADRPPTAEEEELAEGETLDPSVAESYKEAIETGSKVKGEGEID